MPELPEVELARRRLLAFAQGATITKAVVHDAWIVRGQSAATFASKLKGRVIESADRRGKSLLVSLSKHGGLAMHLGMSGSVIPRADSAPRARFARVSFHLSRDGAPAGVVDFDDARKLGLLFAGSTEDARSVAKHDALGPDAATLHDLASFTARLKTARGPIKTALMDQTRIAGLGNIHVGETLFLARLHPLVPVPSLDTADFRRLCAGMHETIDRALTEVDRLEASGETHVYLSAGGENPYLVYDRLGEPCVRCRTPITREVLAGRSTYVCTQCQPKPRVRKAAPKKKSPAKKKKKVTRSRPAPPPRPAATKPRARGSRAAAGTRTRARRPT